jgi:hypothetical protein
VGSKRPTGASLERCERDVSSPHPVNVARPGEIHQRALRTPRSTRPDAAPAPVRSGGTGTATGARTGSVGYQRAWLNGGAAWREKGSSASGFEARHDERDGVQEADVDGDADPEVTIR